MTTAQPIRVLVVDDHTLFLRGLIALLAGDARSQVVTEARCANEAHKRAAQTQPDVILLDNRMPSVNGVDALTGFKASAPQAQVLMLTVSEDERDLWAALRGGARGYLLKSMDGEMLASAIRRTTAGESIVGPQMASKLVSAFQAGQGASSTLPPTPAIDTDPIHNLSPREREIPTLIARGASSIEVARELNIAEATEKIHVQHILRKLKLSSRVQAAVYLTGLSS